MKQTLANWMRTNGYGGDKQVTSREPYLESAIRTSEVRANVYARHRPFDQREAASRFSSWVYAAAMLNAQAVASTPLRLYVRRRPGRKKLYETRPVPPARKRYLQHAIPGHGPSEIVRLKADSFGDDFEEVTERHPVLDLLRAVNPWLNGYNLTTLRILYQELTGNAYLLPIFDPRLGRPIELWPLPPQWTYVIPSQTEFVEGYAFGVETTDLEFFDRDDHVIHFKYPNPNDLFYGRGKVEAGWSILSLQDAKRTHDTALFQNNARPDYAVIVQGGAPDVLQRFENKVRGLLRGTTKAGNFLTVPGNVTIQPLSWPPKDLGDSDDVLEEIAAVFGVPVSLLKANDPNLASARVGYAQWREATIAPLCRQDEEVLNQSFLPLFGLEDDAVLAYDNPIPADDAQQLQESQTLTTHGIRTINEDRALRGDPPVEGGDVPRFNGVPLDQVGQPAASPFGGFFGPPPSGPQERPDDGDDGDGSDDPDHGDDPPSGTSGGDEIVDANLVSAGSSALEAKADRHGAGSGGGVPDGVPDLPDAGAPDVGTKGSDRVVGSDGNPSVGVKPTPAREGEDRSECVARNVADLIAEGVPRDDAIRMAVAVCADAGGDAEPKSLILQSDLFTGKVVLPCQLAHKDEWPDAIPHESAANEFTIRFTSILHDLIETVVATVEESVDPSTVPSFIPELIKDSFTNVADLTQMLADFAEKEIEEAKEKAVDALEQQGIVFCSRKNAKARADAPCIELDFGVVNEALEQYVDDYVVRLRRQLGGSLTHNLRSMVDRGIEDGESVSQIANRIREYGKSDAPRERARMIARTEAIRARTVTAERTWEATGVVEGKKWLLAPRACEFCRAVAKKYGRQQRGTQAVPIGQPFLPNGTVLEGTDGGRMRLDYDPQGVFGPPLHPNCRCTTTPVVRK